MNHKSILEYFEFDNERNSKKEESKSSQNINRTSSNQSFLEKKRTSEGKVHLFCFNIFFIKFRFL